MPPRPRPLLRSERGDDISEPAVEPIAQDDSLTDPIEDDSGLSEYESQRRAHERSRVRFRPYDKQSDSSDRKSNRSLATSTTLETGTDRGVHKTFKPAKANDESDSAPFSDDGFEVHSYKGGNKPSRSGTARKSRVSSGSPRARTFKEQGLTQRSSVTPERAYGPASDQVDDVMDRDTGSRSRVSRGAFHGSIEDKSSENESGAGLLSSRRTKSKGDQHFSPERARKAYLSPPPTVRHPPVTPGAPPARGDRRSIRPSPTPSRPDRRSHKREHDVYAVVSSDDEPAVRVKRTTRRKMPLSGEVVNITTDDEMPSRISSARKLEFTRDDSPQANYASDDVDEDGNLRDFVVPDKDISPAGSALNRSGRDSVKTSRKSRSSRALEDPFSVDPEEASQNMRDPVDREPDARGSVPRNAISAKGNDGARVDLQFKSSSVKRKIAARSLSRESDAYQPSSKRPNRAQRPSHVANMESDSELTTRGRSEKKQRQLPSRDNNRQDVESNARKTGSRTADSSTPMSTSRADFKRAGRSASREAEGEPVPKREFASTRGPPVEARSAVKYSVSSGNASSRRPLVADKKCRVTREEDQEGFLVNSYDDCVAYLSATLLKTPQETGAVGVSHLNSSYNGLPLFDAENISVKRLAALIMLKECAGGMIVNPARADPASFSTTKYTTGNNVTLHNLAKNGENVDLVIFAFVAQDGSSLNTLTCPSGPNAPQNRGYHALNVYPLNGEYQRTLAFMHQVLAPAKQECQMYTNGNAWQATSLWGDTEKYQGRKPLPQHVRVNAGQGSATRGSRGVHPALSRFAKNYMADIPIFDSRRHFLESHVPEDWRDDFSPESILSQVDSPDERFQGEIPDDSLVAMHCVVSMRSNGSVSLNLIGAQVLVTPRGVFHSDLVSGRGA